MGRPSACLAPRLPRVSSLLTALLLLCSSVALAADREGKGAGEDLDVKDKERRAKTACLSGDYQTGVAVLADLYVATNNLTYLFNQARCFEQNGRYADAVIRLREYQRKNRSAGNAPDAEVERHIAECEALLEKERAQAAMPPAGLPPAGSPSAGPPPAAREPAPVAAVAEQTSSPPTSAGSGLRTAGIAAMVLGALGVGTGVVLNLEANSVASELTSSPTSYDRDRASTRSTYEALAWVGYGVGAACVAGGVILYVIGHSQKDATTTPLAFQPMVGRDAYGAVLRGAF